LTVDTSGNVGIGTTSPTSSNGTVGTILNVNSTGNVNTVAVLSSGATSGSNTGGIFEARSILAVTGDPRLGQLDFGRVTDVTTGKISSKAEIWVNDDGTFLEAMHILPSGNVGIGTSNPNDTLEIGTGNIRIPFAAFSSGTPTQGALRSPGSTFGYLTLYDGSTGETRLWNTGPYPMSFGTNNTQQVTILSSGNVGIGATSPGYKLDVAGNVNVRSGYSFLYNGGCVAGNCASDLRLKKDIAPITGSLDRIRHLRPVHYRYRAKEHPDLELSTARQAGFIAQEFEKVFPDLVHEGKDGYKHITYDLELTVQTIQAIRELKEEKDRELSAVKTELEASKARNDQITAYLCAKDPGAPFCRKSGR
jgi:hypothetical protein